MKETDLDKAKILAKIFLEMEVVTSEWSPGIVQHPFAYSGYFHYRTADGCLHVIDITTPQGFDDWKNIMRERIGNVIGNNRRTEIFERYRDG